MQTESPASRHVKPPTAVRVPTHIRRLLLGAWAVGAALVFLIIVSIGVDERTALPLVGILAGAVSAEVLAGVTCLLKGYRAVGWLAVAGWLVFPFGSAVSTAMFPDSWEPALLGSALATGVILVVAALAAVTAFRPARWNSRWDRAGWSGRD